MKETLRTAFLISGRGSTVEAVVRAWQQGQLNGIEPALVVSSNPKSFYLAKAADKRNNLPVSVEIVEKTNISDALLALFEKYDIRLVSQNGWMEFTPKKVRDKFPLRIINQHPGKTPEFAGLIAQQAVCAAIAYAWMTGENPVVTATVHHVIREVDMGNIISTEDMPIPMKSARLDMLTREPADLINTTKTLYQQFLPHEYHNVINALRIIVGGDENEIRGKPPVQEYGLGNNAYYLDVAKEIAKQHF